MSAALSPHGRTSGASSGSAAGMDVISCGAAVAMRYVFAEGVCVSGHVVPEKTMICWLVSRNVAP